MKITMKTRTVVTIFLAAVASSASVACGDATLEATGSESSASQATEVAANGKECQVLRAVQCVAGRHFVCYDASTAGAAGRVLQWGDDGTNACSDADACDASFAPTCNGADGTHCKNGKVVTEPYPNAAICKASLGIGSAPASDGSGSAGACDASFTPSCVNAEGTRCKDGKVVTETYPSAQICRLTLGIDSAPPSDGGTPAAKICTPGQKQCTKRASNGKYRMEVCNGTGTDWVTNQLYVSSETTDPTDCRKAAGLPY